MTEPDELEVEVETLEERLDPDTRDPEAPPADAQEQATPAKPSGTPEMPHIPLEVNEYDAIEQALVVELDDEYR